MGAFETGFLKVCPGYVGPVQARAQDGLGNPRLLQVGVAEFSVGEAGTQDSTSGSLLPKGGMGRSPWLGELREASPGCCCWSALTTVPCLGAAQVVAGVPAAVVHGAAAGHPAWPLPQCTHAPAAVVGVRSAGACGLPLSGRPRPVSVRPDSRYQPAAAADAARHGIQAAGRVDRCADVPSRTVSARRTCGAVGVRPALPPRR
jgi:hypothetical protein